VNKTCDADDLIHLGPRSRASAPNLHLQTLSRSAANDSGGMRAISVQVNEVVGVAGFVTPGNHVDVVATISRQENSMSRVVVSNVKVLAAGTKLDQQRAQTGEPIQTTVVTLLVTPTDGERIALASVEGRLHLTLRNPLDAEPTTTSGVRVASLLGSAEPPPVQDPYGSRAVRTAPPPPPREPVVAKIYTVEAIRAAKTDRGGRQVIVRELGRRSFRLVMVGCTLAALSAVPTAQVQAPAGSPERVLITVGRSTVLQTDYDVTRHRRHQSCRGRRRRGSSRARCSSTARVLGPSA